MAIIYANEKTGVIARASDLTGIKELAEDLGFKILINNYRSFFYGIYRRFNSETKKYEFRKVSKINEEKEQVLLKEGFEKIKDAYSNQIPKEFLWNTHIRK
ncbi:hypothetical protein [uncultured Tissierella sp.]|jgi:hypothetical protein|uniref:hypothetical protein n=1 Tax=uncultured Tissierella sp. TaxID=448160 RepID=UPI002805CCD5|nr:hypothetical protein [uncultured Tissierella sp.]MDU5082722.1 hypothetical protein [Bacillota bacterium]